MIIPFTSGTVTTDGTEQIVVSISQLCKLSGYISLENMQGPDVVWIRQYVGILTPAPELYWAFPYSGVQPDPALRFPPREVVNGMQITLQQTAGIFRSFNFQFVKEPAAAPVKYKL